jgi:hypothetical protein
MSEPKFTRGPYRVLRRDKPLSDWTGSRFSIRASNDLGGADVPLFIAILIGGIGDEQEESTAHLLASAPDLSSIVEEYFKSGCKCDEMPETQICTLCQKASDQLERLGIL